MRARNALSTGGDPFFAGVLQDTSSMLSSSGDNQLYHLPIIGLRGGVKEKMIVIRKIIEKFHFNRNNSVFWVVL